METQTINPISTPKSMLTDAVSIKEMVKSVVNNSTKTEYVLKLGFGKPTPSFNSKKEFGNYVLSLMDRKDFLGLSFSSESLSSIFFQVHFKEGNGRGYGQGRYLGD